MGPAGAGPAGAAAVGACQADADPGVTGVGAVIAAAASARVASLRVESPPRAFGAGGPSGAEAPADVVPAGALSGAAGAVPAVLGGVAGPVVGASWVGSGAAGSRGFRTVGSASSQLTVPASRRRRLGVGAACTGVPGGTPRIDYPSLRESAPIGVSQDAIFASPVPTRWTAVTFGGGTCGKAATTFPSVSNGRSPTSV